MALEDLIAAMERDAAEEVRRQLETAQAEADRIKAAGEGEASRRREDLLGRTELELRQETAAALAAATREARRDVLFARERLLDNVFQAAAARLPVLVDDARYRAVVGAEFEEAVGYLPEGGIRLRCSPGLLGLAEEHVGDLPGISIEPDAGVGSGFVLEAADGSSALDATLERRLADQRGSLALVVLQHLPAIMEGGEERS